MRLWRISGVRTPVCAGVRILFALPCSRWRPESNSHAGLR